MYCKLCKAEAEIISNSRLSMKVPDNFPLDGNLKLGYCKGCDFIFNINSSKKEDYFNYYKNFNKHRPRTGALELIDKEYYLNVLNFIEGSTEFDTQGADILDFGSPSKLFSEIALSKGANQANNFDVGYPNSDSLYNLIISFHCFEHIFDPLQTFASLLVNLKKNGYICIVVPDAHRYLDYYYGPYSNFDIEHINHFSLLSLSKLFELNNVIFKAYRFAERLGSPNLVYPEILFVGQLCNSRNTHNLRQFNAKDNKLIKLFKKSDLDLDFALREFKKIIFKNTNAENEIFGFYGLGPYAFRLINLIEKKLLHKIDFYADSNDKLSIFKINNKFILNKDNFYIYVRSNFDRGIKVNIFLFAINSDQIKLMLVDDLSDIVNIHVLPPNCANRKET
jgi:hypothetical protein